MSKKAEIHVHGPSSLLKGQFPMLAVKEATSWAVEGAQFSKAYRKGVWDGRKHLFRPASGSFPTGLVPTVVRVCEEHDVEVEVIDHRAQPAAHIDHPKVGTYDLEGVSFEFPRDYQLAAAQTMVEKMQGICRIATNGGKCLGVDTPVRMADGRVKQAQDVVEGDQLMGPDGLPRTVLSTCRGAAPLFRIDQKRGMSYVCNDVHVLTLQDTRSEKGNQTVDIPLNEYLEKDNYFKHCFKHFSVGVEYHEAPVEVDPYFVGLWLGDGTKALKTVAVTTKDHEIVEYLKGFAASWGCSLTEDNHPNNQASTYHISSGSKRTNPLLDVMRKLVGTSLRIPSHYLINDRENRLKLLAGILDSDGHYMAERGAYDLTLKDYDLILDVYHLCRSLGYGVGLPKEKWVKLPDGRDAVYWRICIRGVSPENGPPVKLGYKRPTYVPKKCATRTKFSVTPIGEGEYAGFTLTGDGRFLLEDYTVTHNTEVACAVTQKLGLNTLFTVGSVELLHQARERFKKRFQVGDDVVGIVGDSIWEPGSWVTIASLNTLESRLNTKECQELLKNTEVFFMDECHHAGSETWYTVASICPAYYRFGLSGTPLDRTDGANLRLIAACGDVVVDIPNKMLVERGISAKAHVIFDKITEPNLLASKEKIRYPTVYKKCVVENEVLLDRVVEWTKVFRELNLGTLILCEEIAHGKAIDNALWNRAGDVFLPHQFIHGNESPETRASALADFSDGSLPILVASTILDEGVDVPTIDALILAGSRKSRIKTMQRLGRGLRGKQLVVVEFANFCHEYLLDHSKQRLLDYKIEDCFPIHRSGPNVELVKKILAEQ